MAGALVWERPGLGHWKVWCSPCLISFQFWHFSSVKLRISLLTSEKMELKISFPFSDCHLAQLRISSVVSKSWCVGGQRPAQPRAQEVLPGLGRLARQQTQGNDRATLSARGACSLHETELLG